MIRGENILEEALAFTTTNLELIANQSSHPHAIQVKHNLRQILHKNVPRIEARSYISIYEQDPSHNENLLILAKLDFNMLQDLHRKEFGNSCKWWKDLDVHSKLPYARDRIVESCFWALGAYFEPKYSVARSILTKLLIIITCIDDTFDAYGTIDELELFTKAIELWDINCADNLPKYMKFLYKLILDLYEEVKNEMRKEGREYAPNCYAKEFIKYVQAYMTEARWLNNNYKPTLEEYIRVSTESSGYAIVTTTCYIGMGDIATEDVFKWVSSEPKAIYAAIVICRLMDDPASNEFEQKRDHISSFLECYMKKYNVCREAAIEEGRKRIANAWIDLNEECLRPTQVPMPILTIILNLSRFMDVVYKDKDNFTHPEALLIDPIPI
ncbi:putative terpene synthase [Trifolium repens]|nr:putative terpene synthase [Trifolium repens]